MATADIRSTCEEDRCAASDERGNPCRLKREPDSVYCAKHGGVISERVLLRNYNLTRWKAEVNQKLRSDGILSLREEVGIARITLEQTLNSCQSATDLMMYQPKIIQLVQTIQKTVESCQRVEEKTDQLLSKTALLQFVDETVQIISRNITDPAIRAAIASELMLKLETITNSTAPASE